MLLSLSMIVGRLLGRWFVFKGKEGRYAIWVPPGFQSTD